MGAVNSNPGFYGRVLSRGVFILLRGQDLREQKSESCGPPYLGNSWNLYSNDFLQGERWGCSVCVTVCVWRSDGYSGVVPSVHRAGSGDPTQVGRLARRQCCLLSCLASARPPGCLQTPMSIFHHRPSEPDPAGPSCRPYISSFCILFLCLLTLVSLVRASGASLILASRGVCFLS